MIIEVFALGAVYTPPNVERLTDRFSRVPVSERYTVAFGGSNVHMTNNGTNADLSLNKSSGSGLMSKNKYYYGFFSAAMKLPAGFTSGVVVAFYLSNSDVFPHNHDEIDIELLGHERRKDWVLQTNIYGNGSVKTGREEKFYLWFDPTTSFHEYSILWNNHHIVFLVDNVPVREVIHNTAISSVYPSKPMSVYTTIWDGSEWATRGWKIPRPSCTRSSPSSLDPVDGEEFAKLSSQQTTGLQWARGKHMFYSYCKDASRYKVLPPECNAK
ncbi:putative xyloglucan endotransglucosylase/hydrolase protein 33 [Abeliophyllum distichum]|uniref:Xyloglucan endotransglucosylase/hydrolase n=1 Tax=Abeliophyllum distichum TaxID=126358 RepID=A0ABD1U3D9_9LAMI